jgi:hypothetical protein
MRHGLDAGTPPPVGVVKDVHARPERGRAVAGKVHAPRRMSDVSGKHRRQQLGRQQRAAEAAAQGAAIRVPAQAAQDARRVHSGYQHVDVHRTQAPTFLAEATARQSIMQPHTCTACPAA